MVGLEQLPFRTAPCFECVMRARQKVAVFLPADDYSNKRRQPEEDACLPIAPAVGAIRSTVFSIPHRVVNAMKNKTHPSCAMTLAHPSHRVLPWRTVSFCLVLGGAVNQPDPI
jgi:hypothetical protein